MKEAVRNVGYISGRLQYLSMRRMSQYPVAVLNWLLCALFILGVGSLTVGGRACGARPRQHEGGGQDVTRQDATRPRLQFRRLVAVFDGYSCQCRVNTRYGR